MAAAGGEEREASGPAPTPAHKEARRVTFEAQMMDADRITMQTVQTSLSLIGFGFSISTFFTEVSRPIFAAGGGQMARFMGAALLIIGLVLLSGGLWHQSRYRRELQVRYATLSRGAPVWVGMQTRFTPSYLSAVLLWLVGVLSLGSVIFRWVRLSLS
jgi:putative membrane protein